MVPRNIQYETTQILRNNDIRSYMKKRDRLLYSVLIILKFEFMIYHVVAGIEFRTFGRAASALNL